MDPPPTTPGFQQPVRTRLLHFYSTRQGGVSRPPYDSLNLGLHVGDDPAAVLLNRRRLCEALGFPLEAWTGGQQVHGGQVRIVTPTDRGRGSSSATSALEGADALVTAEAGICLVVLVADCVPLLLVDEQRLVIAVAHAGWRGTAANIARRTVEVMERHFGCRRDHIRAAIGPCIGRSDYPIGPEVATVVRTALGPLADDTLARDEAGRMLLDLRLANRQQLAAAGIRPEAIETWGVSTYRATDRYFSARAAGGPTGRFAGGLMLWP